MFIKKPTPWFGAILCAVLLALPAQSRATPAFWDIFNTHTAIMLLINPDNGAIVDANAAASEYYGYPLDTLKSMTIQQINQLTPEQVAAERRLAKSQGRNHFIFRHKLASGEVRSVEVFSVPLTIDDEVLLFSIIHDVSLGRIQEENVLHYQSQLEDIIEQRTKEFAVHEARETIWMVIAIAALSLLVTMLVLALKKARKEQRNAIVAMDRSQEDSRAKSQFLSSMSHELRTPLNAILGFSQLLKYDTRNPLTPAQQDHVDYILQGGNHLLSLVNDVLDLAQIEASKLTIEATKVDLRDVLEECLKLVAPLAEQKHVSVALKTYTLTGVYLYTDRRRLLQILFNLVSNGIKFSAGGGAVEIVGTDLSNGFYRTTVRDTGIGIKDEDQKNVFQPFHRLDEDPMVAHEGAGIGLVVTKMLIKKLAGQIGFESTYGKGTSFWFDLPMDGNTHVIIWDDAMRTGIDPIDKDHEVIAGMINTLAAAPSGVDLPVTFIRELVAYTKYHFKREEIVMKACGFPDYSEHRAYHVNLGKRVEKMKSDIEANRSLDLAAYKDFLRLWWSDHILGEDIKIGEYAIGKESEIKQALEKAYF